VLRSYDFSCVPPRNRAKAVNRRCDDANVIQALA
jgi:hypothetical protein